MTKLKKPWHNILGKEQKIGPRIYKAAKLLKENGYTRDDALRCLRRGEFAQVPSHFVKKYVDEAFRGVSSIKDEKKDKKTNTYFPE